jgi:acetolactate synthase regulatory subunit
MEGKVYARLDQGFDSFLRVANILRRKEFIIKSLNMVSCENSDVNIEVQIDECKNTLNEVANVMLKLADVKEVKVL